MTFPACLRKVLKERVQEQRGHDGSFVLREKGVMTVEVSDVASDAADAVVVRLDRIGELGGLKEGPWQQACDYMVLRQVRETVQALFVELKKTLTGEEKGLEQLRRSSPFLRYLSAVCRIECGFEPREPEVRYTVVATKYHHRLDKQRIRAYGNPQTRSHKGIEVALHVVGQRVGFDRLWNG